MQFVPLLLLVRPMKSLRFLLAASQQVNLLSFHRRGEETQNSWVKDKNRSHSVVSDSLQTPWTIQSIEFSRPEYLSGQPFPSPGDLQNPGTEPRSPALQVDSLPAEPSRKPQGQSPRVKDRRHRDSRQHELLVHTGSSCPQRPTGEIW